MANDNDKVREICDLVRIPRLDLFKTYNELADRILAAHEREMAAKDAEIAWLRAALNPVMECDLGSPNQMAAWEAVREAQSIFNEGEEN